MQGEKQRASRIKEMIRKKRENSLNRVRCFTQSHGGHHYKQLEKSTPLNQYSLLHKPDQYFWLPVKEFKKKIKKSKEDY